MLNTSDIPQNLNVTQWIAGTVLGVDPRGGVTMLRFFVVAVGGAMAKTGGVSDYSF